MQQAHVRPTTKDNNNKFFSMYYPAVGTGQYWIWDQVFVLIGKQRILFLLEKMLDKKSEVWKTSKITRPRGLTDAIKEMLWESWLTLSILHGLYDILSWLILHYYEMRC